MWRVVALAPYMMDDLTRKFFEEAKAIALTDAERAEVREYICTFLEDDLVSTEEAKRHTMVMTSSRSIDKGLLGKGDKKSVRQKLVRMMRKTSDAKISSLDEEEEEDVEPHRVLSAAFFGGILTRLSVFALVFAFAGVGISSAAKGSLPGDYLYSYKINVSERMTELFTVSHFDRASWNTERTLRRLSEAEALIERGEKDAFVLKNTHEQFLKGLQASRSSVEAVKAQGLTDEAVALATDLESGLRIYYDSFLSLKHSESSKEWAELFHKNLRESIEEAADMNVTIKEGLPANNKVLPAAQIKRQPVAATGAARHSSDSSSEDVIPAIGNTLQKQEEDTKDESAGETQEETEIDIMQDTTTDNQDVELLDEDKSSENNQEGMNVDPLPQILDEPGKILPDLLKKDDKNVIPL